MKYIITIRHGISKKNLKQIYGGNGEDLLDEGIKQILLSAQDIKKFIKSHQMKTKIYKSCNRVQVAQSAIILAKELNIDTVFSDPDYAPIRLGAWHGLTKTEQEQRFPKQKAALNAWNNGTGDIREFEFGIEGLQTAKEHNQQILRFVENLENNCIHILLGTRSDLSAIKNALYKNNVDDYCGYKYYESDFAETRLFQKSGEKYVDIDLKKFNENDFVK